MLLTATMERRPEIGFASYDRLFPSQDTMPAGGFGNLIALPLQRRAHELGNSLFVDDDLRPYDDQWTFLYSLARLDRVRVTALVTKAETRDPGVLGVRMPVEDEDADEPWLLPPSRRRGPEPITGPLPDRVEVVLADGVYLDRSRLPPPLVAHLVRLAAFQNPEFHRAQAMRLSTFGKPRIISCAELHPHHVALPRDCLDEALELFHSHGVGTDVVDHREAGTPLVVRFLGTLRGGQAAAVEALSSHDCGVLAATTAFGKVDECHHLSAVSFELVARRPEARHVLGLSATVARKDGHHPIIFMQCGPVRHRVDARSQAVRRGFTQRVRLRETGFQLSSG